MLVKISIIIGGVISGIYIISLIRVMIYEKRINKLKAQKQDAINKIRNRSGVDMFFVNATIKNINEEDNPKIEKLERKRRFILDKIPFINIKI